MAAWVFFGISGYVICYGFISHKYRANIRDVRDFYLNRFIKILPLFIFLSFFAWSTEIALTGKFPISWRDIPAEIFALQFNHNYRLNGVFWTLGIELQFYLIASFILLSLLWISSNRVFHSFAIIFLYLIILFLYKYNIDNNGWSYDGRNILANFSHFLIGIFGCIVTYRMRYTKILFCCTLFSSVGLILLTAWIYKNQPANFWSINGILLVDMLIFSLIIFHAFSQRNVNITASFIYKPLFFLGSMAYGIYGWHAYIMKYSPIKLDQSLSLSIFLLMPLSILATYITNLILERPLQRFRREKVTRY